MRLIDADALEKEFCHGCQYENNKYVNCIDCAVANAPTVDAVEVIRCGECAHNCGRVDGYICCDKTKEISIWHSEDWFCADGKRRQKRNGKRSTGRRQSR